MYHTSASSCLVKQEQYFIILLILYFNNNVYLQGRIYAPKLLRRIEPITISTYMETE